MTINANCSSWFIIVNICGFIVFDEYLYHIIRCFLTKQRVYIRICIYSIFVYSIDDIFLWLISKHLIKHPVSTIWIFYQVWTSLSTKNYPITEINLSRSTLDDFILLTFFVNFLAIDDARSLSEITRSSESELSLISFTKNNTSRASGLS